MEPMPFLWYLSLPWRTGIFCSVMPFLIILALRKLIYSGEGLAFTVGYWEMPLLWVYMPTARFTWLDYLRDAASLSSQCFFS